MDIDNMSPDELDAAIDKMGASNDAIQQIFKIQSVFVQALSIGTSSVGAILGGVFGGLAFGPVGAIVTGIITGITTLLSFLGFNKRIKRIQQRNQDMAKKYREQAQKYELQIQQLKKQEEKAQLRLYETLQQQKRVTIAQADTQIMLHYIQSSSIKNKKKLQEYSLKQAETISEIETLKEQQLLNVEMFNSVIKEVLEQITQKSLNQQNQSKIDIEPYQQEEQLYTDEIEKLTNEINILEQEKQNLIQNAINNGEQIQQQIEKTITINIIDIESLHVEKDLKQFQTDQGICIFQQKIRKAKQQMMSSEYEQTSQQISQCKDQTQQASKQFQDEADRINSLIKQKNDELKNAAKQSKKAIAKKKRKSSEEVRQVQDELKRVSSTQTTIEDELAHLWQQIGGINGNLTQGEVTKFTMTCQHLSFPLQFIEQEVVYSETIKIFLKRKNIYLSILELFKSLLEMIRVNQSSTIQQQDDNEKHDEDLNLLMSEILQEFEKENASLIDQIKKLLSESDVADQKIDDTIKQEELTRTEYRKCYEEEEEEEKEEVDVQLSQIIQKRMHAYILKEIIEDKALQKIVSNFITQVNDESIQNHLMQQFIEPLVMEQKIQQVQQDFQELKQALETVQGINSGAHQQVEIFKQKTLQFTSVYNSWCKFEGVQKQTKMFIHNIEKTITSTDHNISFITPELCFLSNTIEQLQAEPIQDKETFVKLKQMLQSLSPAQIFDVFSDDQLCQHTQNTKQQLDDARQIAIAEKSETKISILEAKAEYTKNILNLIMIRQQILIVKLKYEIQLVIMGERQKLQNLQNSSQKEINENIEQLKQLKNEQDNQCQTYQGKIDKLIKDEQQIINEIQTAMDEQIRISVNELQYEANKDAEKIVKKIEDMKKEIDENIEQIRKIKLETLYKLYEEVEEQDENERKQCQENAKLIQEIKQLQEMVYNKEQQIRQKIREIREQQVQQQLRSLVENDFQNTITNYQMTDIEITIQEAEARRQENVYKNIASRQKKIDQQLDKMFEIYQSKQQLKTLRWSLAQKLEQKRQVQCQIIKRKEIQQKIALHISNQREAVAQITNRRQIEQAEEQVNQLESQLNEYIDKIEKLIERREQELDQLENDIKTDQDKILHIESTLKTNIQDARKLQTNNSLYIELDNYYFTLCDQVKPRVLMVNITFPDIVESGTDWLIGFCNTQQPVLIPKLIIGPKGSLCSIIRNMYWAYDYIQEECGISNRPSEQNETIQLEYFSLISHAETLTVLNNTQALKDLLGYIDHTYRIGSDKWKHEQLELTSLEIQYAKEDRDNASELTERLSYNKLRAHKINLVLISEFEYNNFCEQKCWKQVFCKCREIKAHEIQQIFVNTKILANDVQIEFRDADLKVIIPYIKIGPQGNFRSIIQNKWVDDVDEEESNKQQEYYSLINHAQTFYIENNSVVFKDLVDYMNGNYQIPDSWVSSQHDQNQNYQLMLERAQKEQFHIILENVEDLSKLDELRPKASKITLRTDIQDEYQISNSCWQQTFIQCNNRQLKELSFSADIYGSDYKVGFTGVDGEVHVGKICIKENGKFSSAVQNYWWNGKHGDEKEDGYYSLLHHAKVIQIRNNREAVIALLEYIKGSYGSGEHWSYQKLCQDVEKDVEIEIQCHQSELTDIDELKQYFNKVTVLDLTLETQEQNEIRYDCDNCIFQNGVTPQSLTVNAQVTNNSIQFMYGDVSPKELPSKITIKSKGRFLSLNKSNILGNHTTEFTIDCNQEAVYELAEWLKENRLNENAIIKIDGFNDSQINIEPILQYNAIIDGKPKEEWILREKMLEYGLEPKPLTCSIDVAQTIVLSRENPVYHIRGPIRDIKQIVVEQQLDENDAIYIHDSSDLHDVKIDQIIIEQGGSLRNVLQNCYCDGEYINFFSILHITTELVIKYNNIALKELVAYANNEYQLNEKWEKMLDRNTKITIYCAELNGDVENIKWQLDKSFDCVQVNDQAQFDRADHVIDEYCSNYVIGPESKNLILNAGIGQINVEYSDSGEHPQIEPENVVIDCIEIGPEGDFNNIIQNQWNGREEYRSIIHNVVGKIVIKDNEDALKKLAEYIGGNSGQNARDTHIWRQLLNENIEIKVHCTQDSLVYLGLIRDRFTNVKAYLKIGMEDTTIIKDDCEELTLTNCINAKKLIIEAVIGDGKIKFDSEQQVYVDEIEIHPCCRQNLQFGEGFVALHKFNSIVQNELVGSDAESRYYSLLQNAQTLTIVDDRPVVQELIKYISGSWSSNGPWGCRSLDRNMKIKIQCNENELDDLYELKEHFKSVIVPELRMDLRENNRIKWVCSCCVFKNCQNVSPYQIIVDKEIESGKIVFENTSQRIQIRNIVIKPNGKLSYIINNATYNFQDQPTENNYSLIQQASVLSIQNNINAIYDLVEYISNIQDENIQQQIKKLYIKIMNPGSSQITLYQIQTLDKYFQTVTVDGLAVASYFISLDLNTQSRIIQEQAFEKQKLQDLRVKVTGKHLYQMQVLEFMNYSCKRHQLASCMQDGDTTSVNVLQKILQRHNLIEERCDQCYFTCQKEVCPLSLTVNAPITSQYALISFYGTDAEPQIENIVIDTLGDVSSIIRNWWCNITSCEKTKHSYFSLISNVKKLTIKDNPQALEDIYNYVMNSYDLHQYWMFTNIDKTIDFEIECENGYCATIINKLQNYFERIKLVQKLNNEIIISQNCWQQVLVKNDDEQECNVCKLTVSARMKADTQIEFRNVCDGVQVEEIVITGSGQLKSVLHNTWVDKQGNKHDFSLLQNADKLWVDNNEVLGELVEKIEGMSESDYLSMPHVYIKYNENQVNLIEHLQQLKLIIVSPLQRFNMITNYCWRFIFTGCNRTKAQQLFINNRLWCTDQQIEFWNIDHEIVISKIIIGSDASINAIIQNKWGDSEEENPNKNYFSLLTTAKEIVIIDNFQALKDLLESIKHNQDGAMFSIKLPSHKQILKVCYGLYSNCPSVLDDLDSYFTVEECLMNNLQYDNRIDQEKHEYMLKNCGNQCPASLTVDAKLLGDDVLIRFYDAKKEVHIPQITIEQNGQLRSVTSNSWQSSFGEAEKQYSLIQHTDQLSIKNNEQAVKDLLSYVNSLGDSTRNQVFENTKLIIEDCGQVTKEAQQLAQCFSSVILDGELVQFCEQEEYQDY